MKYVYIGKIVNTHALKGEVRLISDFEFKDRVFKSGVTFYMGQFKTPEIVETYRPHKQFDMVKFVGIDYINDVVKYKGDSVYVDESILNLKYDEILDSEFTNMSVYIDDKLIGKIEEYRNDNGNKVIKLNNKFIPYNPNFVTKIDKQNNIIYMHDIEVFL